MLEALAYPSSDFEGESIQCAFQSVNAQAAIL